MHFYMQSSFSVKYHTRHFTKLNSYIKWFGDPFRKFLTRSWIVKYIVLSVLRLCNFLTCWKCYLETGRSIHQSYGSTFSNKIINVPFVSSCLSNNYSTLCLPRIFRIGDQKLDIQKLSPKWQTGFEYVLFHQHSARERGSRSLCTAMDQNR